jgi:hypothetical protein
LSTTLKLTRQAFGLELRRGTFDIEVAGERVGSIEWLGEVEIPVEPRTHSLRLRAGRYSSQSHTLNAGDESIVSFRCHGAMLWPRYVASAFKTDLAISLARESMSNTSEP